MTQAITCYWQSRRNRDSISFEEWVDLDLCKHYKMGSARSVPYKGFSGVKDEGWLDEASAWVSGVVLEHTDSTEATLGVRAETCRLG